MSAVARPASEEARRVLSQLAELSSVFPWKTPSEIEKACQTMMSVDPDKKVCAFSLLFEGPDPMAAPPWGSVYQDRENLLMGASTLNYRRFLNHQALQLDSALNEPEDQFGLMILAMAYFMEAENDEAVVELLQVHLLPWAGRYLELLEEADDSGFYAALVAVTRLFMEEVTMAYEVIPDSCQLYR